MPELPEVEVVKKSLEDKLKRLKGDRERLAESGVKDTTKEDLKIIDQYRLYRNKLVHSQINLDEIPVPELNSYMPFIMNIITKIQGFEIH